MCDDCSYGLLFSGLGEMFLDLDNDGKALVIAVFVLLLLTVWFD
jgi:hypothetical protein